MRKPAKNTTDSPLVIDDDGHTLGGGEWGDVDPGDARVQAHVDGGFLVIKDDDAEARQPSRPRTTKTEEKHT